MKAARSPESSAAVKTAGLAGIIRQSRGGDEKDEWLAAAHGPVTRAGAAKGEADASTGGRVSLLGEPELCAS